MPRLFPDRHHVGKEFGKKIFVPQRRRKGRTIDYSAPNLDHFHLEVAIAGDFRYKIDRAQERHAVFHQSAEGPRKLRVIAVANDPAVPGDGETKTVPRDSAFVAAD